MERFQKKFLFVLIANILFVVPFFVFAAGTELTFSPSSGSFSAGENFSVKVILNPDGTKVNAAEATINFDKKILSVVNLSKGGSAFSLWATEPGFSNTKGTIIFSGGTPSPFSNKSTVITITFKALKVGVAETSFSNGSVLAADGKGTDVLSRGLGSVYTIKESKKTPEATATPPKNPDSVSGVTPKAPEITSSTHEKSDKWYSGTEAQFSWILPSDVISVSTLISQEKNVDSDKIDNLHTLPVSSQKVEELEDGEWFFYAQFKNDFGWGEIGLKKILVDTKPPLEFDIRLLSEGVHVSAPKLFFETEDELSGIKYYEVSFGKGVTRTIYPRDLVGGGYPIPPHPGGMEMITVNAQDKAGNIREESGEFLVPYIEKQAVVGSAEGESEEPIWTMERIAILLLVFFSGMVLAINTYQKKQFKKENTIIAREAEEAKEKTDKIFSAIKEELEEQVNAMDKKPQLTSSERELLEKMKEVLDLSEELIDAEIEDLRKITRNG